MPELRTTIPDRPRKWLIPAPLLVVLGAAVVMGLPTLRGSFVGGDDHRLVLNHVLVNHPSLSHAIELFGIVHRDLYQPLPLLTFSGEFLIAGWLGIFDSGVEHGAWLFHLTNVLLHAANAGLVWLLIRRWHARFSPGSAGAVATAAALLFAVHPFQVEAVAWVNGRMMLLSTLFALLTLLSLETWLDSGKPRHAVLTPFFALLSAISKVRAPLPLLAAFPVLLRRERPWRRFWPVGLAVAVVTGVFVWVNIRTTAGAELFSEGAVHLRGPRSVRVVQALAFYIEHLIWPVCLTSYYPTQPEVSWTDPKTWQAMLIFVVAAGLAGWACLRIPACRWAILWAGLAIGDTLPLFPARNILAADRYMYLPLVGVFWFAAAVAIDGLKIADARARTVRWTATAVFTALCAVLVGTSWHTAKWYNSALLKTQRVAECFPNEPRVWEKLGWSYHQLGNYEKALELAQREMVHDNPASVSGACQLTGMTYLRMGEGEKALQWLHRGAELDPQTDIGNYRLGVAYEELGRLEEAVRYYEAAAAIAPRHNPTHLRAADAYRRLGRLDDARASYEKAVENNAFEIPAIVGLVDLDLARGNPEDLAQAERRLTAVIDDVPESVPLRVNLGVVRYALGRTDDAVALYAGVIEDDPTEPTAAVNLAHAVLAASPERIPEAAAGLRPSQVRHPVIAAALILADLCDGRTDEALSRVGALSRSGTEYADARSLLLDALRRYDEHRPGVPWTYALTAEILLADGQIGAARGFADLFASMCQQPLCESHIRRLRDRLAAANVP